MKKLLKLFVVLFIVSCSGNVSKLESYCIDNITDSVTFYLDDLFEDFELVELEYSDDIIVTKSRLAISDDKLLLCNNDRILLFNADNGKYIETIAQKGNGPNEYRYIKSFGDNISSFRFYIF